MFAVMHWRVAAAAIATMVVSTSSLAQPLAMTDPRPFPASIFQQIMPEPMTRAEPLQHATPLDDAPVPAHLRRQTVAYPTNEAPGTIVIDTANTYLYYVLGGGRAIRYGIGVGRDGFTWAGTRSIDRKVEWPDWHPPAEMIARQPYLPRFMAGGPGNPLGARAMYLGGTLYRIHGTNQPDSIGQRVSSGCIRLTNEDVADIYSRVTLGTKVVVLPDSHRRAPANVASAPQPAQQRVTQMPQPAYGYDAPRPMAAIPERPFPLLFGSSASRLY